MVPILFWSVVLRTGQVAIEASTTLVCGLVVAAIMRRMLGSAGTRRLFGGAGWTGLLRAWAVGTLLPVCSLGVIPIAREMRRAGVPSATILAFVLAAPHINPLSLLYGLTLSEPLVILCFAAGSLAVAVAAGAMWERFFASEQDEPPVTVESSVVPGPKRLAAVALAAGQEALSPTMAYVLIGILFTGIFSGLLPHGCLSMTMRHDDPFSGALMTAIALPHYSGPLQGMMRLGLMFEHGNSVGAAFALFELGIGVNLGLLVWLASVYGARRILLWTLLIAGATLILAYASEQPLYFAHEEASHTHAFDEWTSPFASGYQANWQLVRDKLEQKVQTLELVSLSGLAVLFAVGGLVRVFDRAGALNAWLTGEAPAMDRPGALWNRALPGPAVGLTVLAVLIALSVAALYIYYPAPADVFREIVHVRADALVAVHAGNKSEAIRQIEHWDLLTRKLQVGVFIRTGRMDADASKLSEDLRDALEDLRDALLANQLSEAKQMLPKIDAAHRKCRDAYLAGVES